MKTFYKVRYVHTHSDRKTQVHHRKFDWAPYPVVKKFLESAVRNPRISDIRIIERATREMSVEEFLVYSEE